jgi:hypothetical protein
MTINDPERQADDFGTALAAEEMKRRLRLLRTSIGEAKARAEQNLWMSKEHADALVDAIDELAGAAYVAFAGEHAAPGDAQQAVVRAERAWSLFGMIQSQHQDTALGPWLQVADYCVADGYETLRRGCDALGVTSPFPPPPVTFAEAIASPVVYALDAKVRAPGLVAGGLLELPLPVVVYPPNQLQCLWLYSTLHHEVGHAFDRALGISVDLEVAINAGLGASGSERSEAWRSWTREMLADAVGVGLGGEGFAYTLAEVLESLSLLDGWPPLGSHPPPIVRLVLVAGMLEELALSGAGAEACIARTVADLRKLAATALAKLSDPTPFKSYLDDAPVVASLILSSVLPSLGDHPLRAVLPDVHRDSLTARAMAGVLRQDEGAVAAAVRALEPPASWRLLPAAAQLAIRALPRVTEAALDTVQKTSAACRGAMLAPDWVVSPARWRTLRLLIPQLDRSIYEEEQSGYKRPPLELLRTYERIVFVGATHDQLESMLRRATSERNGRRWARLELFFLEDAELAAIAAGEGKAPDDLVRAKALALANLSALLPEVADDWTIYCYVRPYYFASYWDHEARGGRIHVSPFIWGQPVKNCPGLDYSWHKDRPEPTREYRAYSDGLAGLRAAEGTSTLKSRGALAP